MMKANQNRSRYRTARRVGILFLVGGAALGVARAVWGIPEDAPLLLEPMAKPIPSYLSQNGSHLGTLSLRGTPSGGLAANKRWYRNRAQQDKGDDAPYFSENMRDVLFDPCMTATGERYKGTGTVLNPYARENPCLESLVRYASTGDAPIKIDFPIPHDDGLAAPGAGEGPDYSETPFRFDPAEFGPVFGPFNGGAPGTGSPSDPNTPPSLVPIVLDDDPTTPPVDRGVLVDPTPTPLPGALLFFLTGGAVIARLKKKI
ncbi:MAG: hypothetical protein AAF986_08730 [Pseudomonadota bacterium]